MLYQAEIRDALERGSFWIDPLVPAWVPGLLIAHVAGFYSLSGYAKLHDSGLHWADGVSLQLWTSIWGVPGPFASAIVSSRILAQGLQALTLFTEVGALPMALHPRTRTLSGLLLIAFHLGQQLLFGWWFIGNMAIVALVLLPVGGW